METTVTITGIEETVEMLSRLPAQIVASGFAKALRAGITVFERELNTRVPERSEGEHTGENARLADSIRTKVEVDANLRGGTANVGFGRMGHVAMWVEYGHRMVGHKPSNAFLGQVAPHPFIRPAFDSAKEVAVEAFGESLAETVKAQFGQAAA